MSHLKYLFIGSLLLAGCAHKPVAPVQTGQAEQVTEAAASAVVAEATPVLPNIELTDELLYQYLLTEFAAQRGHKALAVEGSAALARETRDPRLTKRAAQLALESGDMNKTVAAFRLWQETDPSAAMATRVLSSLLLRGGRLEEARVEFVKVLKAEEPAVGSTFMQLYPMAAGYPDKAASLQLMRDLAAPYPAVAEAHWVVAQLAAAAGDQMLALNEARRARDLRSEWGAPVALEAALLHKTEPQQSLDLLHRYLSAYPGAGEVRLQYARALLEQKQYKVARDEFQILAHESPDNVDLAFAVALISLQLNDLPGAEAELRQARSIGGKGQDGVEYFLGQLFEAKEDEREALVHYRAVKAGEYQFPAQLRIVYLLNKQGNLNEARLQLKLAPAETPAQQAQVVMIEAQLLSGVRQFTEAYKVLEQGLVKLPDHPDLLYEAAMLADRLGKYDASEKLLRRLIQIKPDHAHAYNALGYSLLERNVRINEAVLLVEKALILSPEDNAIMDSVGWGYYRSGRLDESVAMLRRAYAGNPDPEIAAHLGEVLWVRGDKTEAGKIWQDSLKDHPDNEPLQAVMKRYLP
ncbi:MAG: tetratricopeptide repeat protein [Proteobacteria bacterium]|nr:tetratricopeptide repeat protein [Pseudomonadota bacterium]